MSDTALEQLSTIYTTMILTLDDFEKQYFESVFPVYRKQKIATIQYYALKLYLAGMVIMNLDIPDRKFLEKAFHILLKKYEKRLASYQNGDSCYCDIKNIAELYQFYLTSDKQHKYSYEELAKTYISLLPADVKKDISVIKTAEILNRTNNKIANFISFTLTNCYSNQKKSSNLLLETLKFGVVGTFIVGFVFFLASFLVRFLK